MPSHNNRKYMSNIPFPVSSVASVENSCISAFLTLSIQHMHEYMRATQDSKFCFCFVTIMYSSFHQEFDAITFYGNFTSSHTSSLLDTSCREYDDMFEAHCMLYDNITPHDHILQTIFLMPQLSLQFVTQTPGAFCLKN